MNVAIAQNGFSSFNNALEEFNKHQKHLEQLGWALVSEGLEEKVSIWLLHRHFDLRQNEVMYRAFGKQSYVQLPVDKSSVELSPISWRVNSGKLEAIEFAQEGQFTVSKEEQAAIESIARMIEKLGMSGTFGIVLNEASEIGDMPTFERNDDHARILFTSSLAESLDQEVSYHPSVIRFYHDNGQLCMNTRKRCLNCPSCNLSIPLIDAHPSSFHATNLFGLGVNATIPPTSTVTFANKLAHHIEKRIEREM